MSTLLTRAKKVYQKEGLVTLIKRMFVFLLSWFSYNYSTFYVSEVVPEKKNEANFLPRLNNIILKTVETTQQLDQLSNEGFDLSLFNVTQARQRLEKGAIALLIFVGQELAYNGWMAMTEEAKNTFNPYPYKVDFSNKEACTGGVWTNPKYRRHGLNTYGLYKRNEFLMEKGIKKTWSIALTSNISSQKSHDKLGDRRIYSKARYLRIGRLKFWKETPVESIKNSNKATI